MPRFYFGCEADDPINSWAFRANSFDARLGAVFGSDIGHFDVPDMTKALPEAYELVEHKLSGKLGDGHLVSRKIDPVVHRRPAS